MLSDVVCLGCGCVDVVADYSVETVVSDRYLRHSCVLQHGDLFIGRSLFDGADEFIAVFIGMRELTNNRRAFSYVRFPGLMLKTSLIMRFKLIRRASDAYE